MKALRFVGATRKNLEAFPESARRHAGHELFMVQAGREPADFKPLRTVGPQAPTKFAYVTNPARFE